MNGATTYHATVDRICSALFRQRICRGSAVGAAPAVTVASAGGGSSLKLPARRGLLGADAAHDDIGEEVIFAADGRTRQAAARGDLSDMRQRVGAGAKPPAVGGELGLLDGVHRGDFRRKALGSFRYLRTAFTRGR